MGVFLSATRDAFGYLEDALGYRSDDRAPGRVSYRGQGVVITVLYDDQRSYELSIDIKREGQASPGFDFGEALRSCGAPADLPSCFQVSDETRLPKFIAELAGSLQAHCAELLSGDARAFRRLQELRDSECSAFEQERTLKQAREKAARAWQAGDYAAVIEALQPLEALLSPSERKRLAIARRKLSEAG